MTDKIVSTLEEVEVHLKNVVKLAEELRLVCLIHPKVTAVSQAAAPVLSNVQTLLTDLKTDAPVVTDIAAGEQLAGAVSTAEPIVEAAATELKKDVTAAESNTTQPETDPSATGTGISAESAPVAAFVTPDTENHLP